MRKWVLSALKYTFRKSPGIWVAFIWNLRVCRNYFCCRGEISSNTQSSCAKFGVKDGPYKFLHCLQCSLIPATAISFSSVINWRTYLRETQGKITSGCKLAWLHLGQHKCSEICLAQIALEVCNAEQQWQHFSHSNRCCFLPPHHIYREMNNVIAVKSICSLLMQVNPTLCFRV